MTRPSIKRMGPRVPRRGAITMVAVTVTKVPKIPTLVKSTTTMATTNVSI